MINRFLALVVALVLAAFPWSAAEARLICNANVAGAANTGNCFIATTNPPTADLWANGGLLQGGKPVQYTEIVQDYTGSLLPSSTLGGQNLGSSTFPWQTVYASTMSISGNETITGNLTVTGTSTQIGSETNVSSITVLGAGGLGVTYGITAGSVTVIGASGYIVGASSITTTSGLFGNSLAIAGSTLTATATGVISAPSNPRIYLPGSATTQLLPTNSWTQIAGWASPLSQKNIGWVASSSGTVTVTYAGDYWVMCQIQITPGGTNVIGADIYKNGSTYGHPATRIGTTTQQIVTDIQVVTASAADTITCAAIGQDAGAIINANQYSFFNVYKLP